MAGLDPAIHEAFRHHKPYYPNLWRAIMDRRVKPTMTNVAV
jgi:hypothetical protein